MNQGEKMVQEPVKVNQRSFKADVFLGALVLLFAGALFAGLNLKIISDFRDLQDRLDHTTAASTAPVVSPLIPRYKPEVSTKLDLQKGEDFVRIDMVYSPVYGSASMTAVGYRWNGVDICIPLQESGDHLYGRVHFKVVNRASDPELFASLSKLTARDLTAFASCNKVDDPNVPDHDYTVGYLQRYIGESKHRPGHSTAYFAE